MPLPSIRLLAVFVSTAFAAPSAFAQFTQQPAAAVGTLGGTADFSVSVQVPIAFANLGIAVLKSGTNVSSRFSIVSQSIANLITTSGNFTTGDYTLRISNLAQADVGSYTFVVTVNGIQYGSSSQPAVLTIGTAAAPTITTQPVSLTAQSFGSFSLSVQATGVPAPSYQWFRNAAPIAGATSATYTASPVNGSHAGAYYVVVSNSAGSVTSATAIVNVSGGVLSISSQPSSASLVVGQAATFSVVATQTFSPNYQWLFNGVAIKGANDATYTIPATTAANAGAYSVLVWDSFGSVQSAAANLGFITGIAPTISAQPASASLSVGQSLLLSVTASGTPSPTYQWRKDGAAIPGAVGANYGLSAVGLSDAGTYTVVVSNAAGSVTSNAALVSVSPPPSRLSNLSIRTTAGAGDQTLIVGVVVGGSGTSGTKPLLIRGIGPTLGTFGVPGALADPVLTLYGPTSAIATNDNWNLSDAAAMNAAGAFGLASGTKDSALTANVATGSYTAQITGANGTSGIALAEIYDTSPTASFGLSTPRLVNVSARAQVGTGAGVLIAGFTIVGSTPKTLLVRGIGPTLGAFGVGGALADPQLTVYRGDGSVVAANDDWGGAATLSNAAASVGAFPLSSAASKDAALLVTLVPGGYSAQITGTGGTTGVALVEIYEMP